MFLFVTVVIVIDAIVVIGAFSFFCFFSTVYSEAWNNLYLLSKLVMN